MIYSYFKNTDCKDWDVSNFYRYWIRDHKESLGNLNYQKVNDKLIKSPKDIIALSSTSEEIRKAQSLLKKAKATKPFEGEFDQCHMETHRNYKREKTKSSIDNNNEEPPKKRPRKQDLMEKVDLI
ncbi:hypothetical protein Glove_82g71 [Diversispora epigaea]|uniref:Uncharacterized protein n=1 Tax=Diversispora epigaea TaxID=1348612 RepID=A0A397JEN6_9GLOM|nr:hypothetical protein Glove_82g71 [Diversispora epigaea]